MASKSFIFATTCFVLAASQASGDLLAAPLPRAANAFRPTSILLVRSGTGDNRTRSVNIPGVLQRSFIEEVDLLTNRWVQTIALPSDGLRSGDNVCTLAHGWQGGFKQRADQEGQPQSSADGLVVMLPCYNATVGVRADASIAKTVAVLRADGTLDVSEVITGTIATSNDEERPPAARTAFKAGGAVHLLSSGTVGGGLWSRGTGSRSQLRQASNQVVDPRYATVFNGVTYLSQGSSDGGSNVRGISYVKVGAAGDPVMPGVPTGAADETVELGRMPGTWPSGQRTSPTAFVFADANTLYVAEDSRRFEFQVVKYVTTEPVSQPWEGRWTLNETYFIDGTRHLSHMAGRTEADGVFYLYLSSCASVWRFAPSTCEKGVVVYAPPGTCYHGVAFAPHDPMAAPAPVRIVRPAPAPMPMARVQPQGMFHSSSLLALRAGDGDVYAPGTYMPAFAIEIDVASGESWTQIALPTQRGEEQAACTILSPTTDASYAESFILASGNGRVATVACNDVDVGSTMELNVGFQRTVGIVKADGTVDTSQRLPDAYFHRANPANPPLFRSAYTVDGSAFWLAGRSVSPTTGNAMWFADAGIRTFGYNLAGSSQVSTPAGVFDTRFCAVDERAPYHVSSDGNGDRLICVIHESSDFGDFHGLYIVGWDLPSGKNSTVKPIPGLTGWGDVPMWGFAFESARRLWVASSDGNVLLFERSSDAEAAPWALSSTQKVAADGSQFYTLGGRFEDEEFVLYTTTRTSILRFRTSALTTYVVATAPVNTHWRGVSLAVKSDYEPSATPSSSPTPTSSLSTGTTPSTTPTWTPTRSSTGTPVETRSPSGTAALVSTPSRSAAAASATGTPLSTASGSPQAIASVAAPPVVLLSKSASPTDRAQAGSTSPARTATATGTAAATNASPVGTQRAQAGGQSSRTRTASRTRWRSRSRTPSGSRTSAPSRSRTAAATRSVTKQGVRGTPSRSRTKTRTRAKQAASRARGL